MTGLTHKILVGDALHRLAELPDDSVQCVVSSPPYWSMRDYGVAGQTGLERTPEEYVCSLQAVFEEVRRVLRKDGVLWLNLGDCYSDAGRGGKQGSTLTGRGASASAEALERMGRSRSRAGGLRPKNLVGLPWRVAFALQADGRYLRADVIWHKPNAMPESVEDRPTRSHEYLFMLTRSAQYHYDIDAVREPHVDPRESKNGAGGKGSMRGRAQIRPRGNVQSEARWYNPLGRNRRSVWSIATEASSEEHFAAFPEELPRLCIRASSRQGDTVLDPFTGTSTTGVVALKLGRSFIGIELNPKYAAISRRRLAGVSPLLASAGVA